MEFESENPNSNKSELLAFGCCISLNLANYNDCFVTSDGFINSQLFIKKFQKNDPSNNFALSIFRILPFSPSTSFASQNELYEITQQFKDKSNEIIEKGPYLNINIMSLTIEYLIDFKERKKELVELKTNLDIEINMNLSLYKKLKGTPVLFNISEFQLVHVSTMKYLCLNDSNQDNL